MGPLALYGCANSYTKVYKKTDVQSSTHKVRNNQDCQTLQSSGNQYCQHWILDCPQREITF